jgi:FlaA1/EpsC-like NDP-sugar epimerase
MRPAIREAFDAILQVASTAGRVSAMVAIDGALVAFAGYCALWLRLDGEIPLSLDRVYVQTLPWVLLIRGLVFVWFGLYGGFWRYTGIWDLTRIIGAVTTSSLAVYPLIYMVRLNSAGYPRSVIIFESVLLIMGLGGVRLVRRLVRDSAKSVTRRRVLVFGAGDAGEAVVREMHKGGHYQPVGFIDDDPAKVGRTIHGVTVLGTRDDLLSVVTATSPDEVLVALPSAEAAAIRSFVRKLEAFKLSITTLPSLDEMVKGLGGINHIRPLAIEDLLPRRHVAADVSVVARLMKGKCVLVTGAGGSIGSELCRQIAALGPATLVLYERHENSLYAIENDLLDKGTEARVWATIGDVTDVDRLQAVFAEHRPNFVFHAAAHKHVPLMEANPCEAVKNNVYGTRVVAQVAREWGVDSFVLISTDKAANPSSVMGATKRIAELITQQMSEGSPTRFVSVRFGNVLGSNGSVIPRMVAQIRAGGPVTVTHPEIRRYFMSIPEAVELVLQTAILARDGETFVLDMGEQLKVLDVARNLIRLSGFIPDQEIPIAFIGLRPGEKLFEELVGEGETLEPAGVAKVSRVSRSEPSDGPPAALAPLVDELVRVATEGRLQGTLNCLGRLVPNFRRAGTPEVPVPVLPQLFADRTKRFSLPVILPSSRRPVVPVGLGK